MVAAFDIGNTNIHIGLFDEGALVRKSLIPCRDRALAGKLKALFRNRVCEGLAIASVAPRITGKVVRGMRSICSTRPLMITAHMKSPIRYAYRIPRTLGADRIALMTGALTRYHRNCIIVSFGTAITIDALLGTGKHLGGLIIPGGRISAAVLAQNAALLGRIRLEGTARLLGKSTGECIRSGIINGTSYALQGMIQAIKRTSGRHFHCVATGGGANIFWRRIPVIDTYDADLCLLGVFTLFRQNANG